MKTIIIAAVAENYVIGNDGKIPWHSRKDFQHFKITTINSPVIMGRKTFLSMGSPLKNRKNIIITRNPDNKLPFEDLLYFTSVKQALEYCEDQNHKKSFVIGGGEIYKSVINEVDELIITFMKINPEGDTYFPKIDDKIWEIAATKEIDEFIIHYYTRKNKEI